MHREDARVLARNLLPLGMLLSAIWLAFAYAPDMGSDAFSFPGPLFQLFSRAIAPKSAPALARLMGPCLVGAAARTGAERRALAVSPIRGAVVARRASRLIVSAQRMAGCDSSPLHAIHHTHEPPQWPLDPRPQSACRAGHAMAGCNSSPAHHFAQDASARPGRHHPSQAAAQARPGSTSKGTVLLSTTENDPLTTRIVAGARSVVIRRGSRDITLEVHTRPTPSEHPPTVRLRAEEIRLLQHALSEALDEIEGAVHRAPTFGKRAQP